MAECSYSRCVQERKNIRRELQKWTKNMVYIVGLERVAEELMGRRKWKLYQESISKQNGSIQDTTTDQAILNTLTKEQNDYDAPQQRMLNNNNTDKHEVHLINNNNPLSPCHATPANTDAICCDDDKQLPTINGESITDDRVESLVTIDDDAAKASDVSKLEERLRAGTDETNAGDKRCTHTLTTTTSGEILRVRDWSPTGDDKCLFCNTHDPKLDNARDECVTSPQNDVGEISLLSPQPSESESSAADSHSDSEDATTTTTTPLIPGLSAAVNHLLQQTGTNMAAIENVHSITPLLVAAAFQNNAAMLQSAAGTSPSATPPSVTQAGMPSFYSPGIFPPWYLNSLARNLPGADGLNLPAALQLAAGLVDKQHAQQQTVAALLQQTVTAASNGGEQPLDLSAKPGASIASSLVNNIQQMTESMRLQSNVRVPTIDTKQIFRAKPRMSSVAGRRTYTEDELQAALRDIQSGKLGTRRAAVIYGIPRSTLRNKVYKLAMERERENHLLSSSPVKIEDDDLDDDKESGNEDEKDEKTNKLSMEDILRFPHMDASAQGLRSLLLKTEPLEPSNVLPYIQSLLNATNLGSRAEDIIPELMRTLIADDKEPNGTSERSLSRQSSTNSVIMRLADKHKSSASPDILDADDSRQTTPLASESPSNVILKIPSFKPTSNETRISPDVTPHTATSPFGGSCTDSSSPPIISPKSMISLKDVIAKSISQKFQQNEPLGLKINPQGVEVDINAYKRNTQFAPPTLGHGGLILKNHHSLQDPNLTHGHMRAFPSASKQTNIMHNTQNQAGGKGTRPKRGKYRNYDRDSLVEAVKAVQRGEMSVHRAGSYYGVPHSTLEYKVKERHLMRPRKRDPKPQPLDDKLKDPMRQEKKLMTSKPPSKFDATPNGMKMPLFDPSMSLGYNPPPFPFWPHPSYLGSSFPPGPDLFATQMMQRLQEDSTRSHLAAGMLPTSHTLKSAREMAESLYDGTGTNGSFLDGIIRSSLDVKADPDKQNPSTSSLLDRLCRNREMMSSDGDESCSSNKRRSPVGFAVKSEEDHGRKRVSGPTETVELSNDSNESIERPRKRKLSEERAISPLPPTGRIYVKPQLQEITKPENLKPEVLVRYSRIHDQMEERNGNDESASIKVDAGHD